MSDRFTDRVIKVMSQAGEEAHRLNHLYLGTEHILIAVVREGGSVSRKIFQDFNVMEENVCGEIANLVQPGIDLPLIDESKLPQTPRAKNVIKYAVEEAQALKHNYVGTEHILLGLLRETHGIANKVLNNLGLDIETVRSKISALLGILSEKPDDRF